MKFLTLSLLTLAQSQYAVLPAPVATTSQVVRSVPNPAGRWETPNLCSGCFGTAIVRRDGQVLSVSTDPTYYGQPSYGPPGPVEYISPRVETVNTAGIPSPWGGPQLIYPSAPAVSTFTRAVVAAPIVSPATFVVEPLPYVPPPVIEPPVVLPPAPVVYAAPPAPVFVATPPPVYVAPAVTTYTAPAPQWQGQTAPQLLGYQNIRGVNVPHYADYGGVPIPAPVGGVVVAPKRNWWD